MDEKTAREKATEIVFVYMTRGAIENACLMRGIKVTKSRSTMEQKLIDAMTAEYMKAAEQEECTPWAGA